MKFYHFVDSLKILIGQKVPLPIFRVLLFLRIIYKNILMPEKKKSFGKLHSDKTFYVIRLYPPATGFLSNYNYVLGAIEYACKNNYIPIVDMENYMTLYHEDQPINGTNNVWEYYFVQPSNFTLSEVYNSKNVILSNGTLDSFLGKIENYPQRIEYAAMVPFNRHTQLDINKITCGVVEKIHEGKTLGVVYRATDYQNTKGHSKILPLEVFFNIIEEKKKLWGLDSVFIMTESETALEFFKEKVSDLLYINRPRISKYKSGTNISGLTPDSISKHENTILYLAEVFTLSKCHSIISIPNNGTYVALLWNMMRYKNIEILNTGKY